MSKIFINPNIKYGSAEEIELVEKTRNLGAKVDPKNKVHLPLILTDKFDIEAMRNALYLELNGKKYRTGITAGFFSSTKGGKSYLMAETLKALEKEFDLVLIFSINISNPLFDSLRGKTNIMFFDKFKSDLVQKIHFINSEVDIDKRLSILCVLDDMIDNKEDATLKNMLITYRNANISSFLSSQAYSIVNKKARSNLNFVFLGKFNNNEAKIDIIDIYLSGNPEFTNNAIKTKTERRSMELIQYERDTKDHQFIICDNLNGEKLYLYKVV